MVLFLGIVADPEETHAVWHGMLNVPGIFPISALTAEGRANYLMKKHYFWFGEVGLAAVLAGVLSVPFGIFIAGRTDTTLAFTGTAICFLLLFVFLPKMIRWLMKKDTDVILEILGRNEHAKKMFWALFAGLAGIVLAQVVDPVTEQQIVGIITGVRC